MCAYMFVHIIYMNNMSIYTVWIQCMTFLIWMNGMIYVWTDIVGMYWDNVWIDGYGIDGSIDRIYGCIECLDVYNVWIDRTYGWI